MAVGRVDPRPAGLDRLGRRTVDGAEPCVVVPVQQRGRRRHQLGADVVEDLPGPAQVEHLGFGVRVLGPLQRGADPPHMPAVGEAAEEHGVLRRLVAELGGRCRAPPDRRRSAPGCAGRPAAAAASGHPAFAASTSVRSSSARSAPMRDSSGTLRSWNPVVRSSLGFRAADVQQPVTELEGVDLGGVDTHAVRRCEPRPARCRSGAAANRRLPWRSTSRSASREPGVGCQ